MQLTNTSDEGSSGQAWVLVAIRMEESTLVEMHAELYEGYRRRVPALLPRLRWGTGAE